MKERHTITKIFQLLSIILLYYIAGKNSLFLYTITLSLYNIYSSCFKHITLKERLKNIQNDYSKFKIYKYSSLCVIGICLIFILLSILMSDTINVLLNIDNTFSPYLIMSISLLTEPLVKLALEYLESYNKPKLSNRLLNTYYIIETILFLLISIFTIRVFKLPTDVSISLIYLSKIISLIAVIAIIYLIFKKQHLDLNKTKNDNELDYKKEIKYILKNNNHQSIIKIVKNSYYHLSIIILYVILTTKFSYDINLIEKEITFIYLYGITIINFIVKLILTFSKYNAKKTNIISYILNIFKFTLTISIGLAVTSPLVCKILFNSSNNSLYLMMLSFMSIFLTLYDITFENIKKQKIIYISLLSGIFTKILLIVPLINAFYRMGYNLVYGDIVSTIIGIFISIIINYIYLKNKNKNEKTLEKIMNTLYENMLLCIILIVLQFIIPIKTNNYFISMIILLVYILITLMYLKIKKKKRG